MTQFLITAYRNHAIVRELWPEANQSLAVIEAKKAQLQRDFPGYEYRVRPVSDEDVRREKPRVDFY